MHILRPVGKLGEMVWSQWDELRHAAAVLGTTLFLSAQPRRWRRTVRGAFARQLLFSGVESVRFIVIVAVLVGISVVVPLGVFAGKRRQSQGLGQIVVPVVPRVLGPLFAHLLPIVF